MAVVITIIISVFGYSLLNISQAGQKMGLGIKDKRSLAGWCIWGAATIGSVGALIVIFYALSAGSVSVVGAMAGTGLITMTLFAALVLNEKISLQDIAGILLIVIGSIVIGVFSEYSADTVFYPVKLYFFSVIVVMVFGVGWICGRKKRFGGLITGGGSGALAGISMLFQKAFLNAINTLEPLPAIIADPDRVAGLLGRGGIYLIFWLITAVTSFLSLQFSYKYGKAVHVIPAYNVNLIVMPVMGGVLIFRDNLSVFLIAGIAVIIAGTAILSLSRSGKS